MSLKLPTNRIQQKFLSGNITTTTSNVITFSGLTVGRNYRLSMYVGAARTGTSGSNNAYLEAVHNSSTILLVGAAGDQTAQLKEIYCSSSRIFTAAATTLAINATVSGTSSVIGGGTNNSNAVLEELNDTELTTAFT